jgi:hypothetical protein
MGTQAALMRAPALGAKDGAGASSHAAVRRGRREQTHERATASRMPAALAAIPVFAPGEGTRGSSSVFPRIALQRKLAIGAVDDPLEREADRVAEQVMRMPEPAAVVSADAQVLLRKCPCEGSGERCAACSGERDDALQRKATSAVTPTEAPPIVHDVLASPGQPLDAATRAFMEPRFGYNFSQVRVHTDAKAAESASSVNARAYAVGNNLVFAAGEYGPGTNTGQTLLSHELAHVMQQSVTSVNSLRSQRTAIPDEKNPEAAPLQINRKCAVCEEEKLQKEQAGSRDRILRQAASRYSQSDPNAPANQPAAGGTSFVFCNPPLYDAGQILRALDTAKLWVANAILRIDQFKTGGKTIEEETAVRLALRDNFNITDTHGDGTLLPKTSLDTILDNFIILQGALNQTLQFSCASGCMPGELAWVLPNPEKLKLPPGIITVCLGFFGCDPLKQASTIIHERAHEALKAQDNAYEVSSKYNSLPTIMALENAESYGVAARQIYYGGIHGPGLSCGGAVRIHPLERLELTPGPLKRPSRPEHPSLLSRKPSPPTSPTGLSPESPTPPGPTPVPSPAPSGPVPTPAQSGGASGKTARVRKMETLRGCAYTVTYANQKKLDCDTAWKNEKGKKPSKPVCGVSLVYDIVSVSATGSKCPAKLEGLKVSENTKGDHGCTPPDFVWPHGSCLIGADGKVSGCTDTLTLCGFTDALQGDCTEIVDQEIEVGGQLAEEHEITFKLKKSGKGCTGEVTRNDPTE